MADALFSIDYLERRRQSYHAMRDFIASAAWRHYDTGPSPDRHFAIAAEHSCSALPVFL